MAKKTTSQRLAQRVILIGVIMALGFAVVAINLARVMLVHGNEYKTKAEQNQLRDSDIKPTRGIIYDSNGVILAQSAAAWKIYINAGAIPDNEEVREFVAKELSGVLEDVDKQTIREKTDGSKSPYVVIKSQVEYEEKEKVVAALDNTFDYVAEYERDDGSTVKSTKTYKLRTAVGIDDDVIRYYPYGSLASCVIGFAGADGVGKSGVESEYNDELTGVTGRLITAKNARSDIMTNEYETVYKAENGAGVVLTIDSTIQRYLEDGLKGVYETSGGVGAYGIVMNVKTGAILAMANVPSFDLNNPYGLTEDQKKEVELAEDDEEKASLRSSFYYKNWRNFTVSDTYEPGSVFKIVTTSAGLESGTIDEEYGYTCTGAITVADQTIKCNNHAGHGYQKLRQGLMNSCNPFFISIGQKLGKETFFRYFEAFGFTERTGVDLPAEYMPTPDKTYHSLENMSFVDLSSSAFGQTFQVTPLQMITAISTIANGGNLVTPYVVDRLIDENGNTVMQTQPSIRRQVISAETSALVTSMMEDVVTSGTGKNAYVAGYHVCGKTGTSQKLSKGQGYYVASFGCFAPSYDPEIAALILVDEPKGQINGGQICTPVAAKLFEETLTYLNIEPQYTEEERAKLDTPALNYVGTRVSDARSQLLDENYNVKVVGNGDIVTSQVPAYGTIIPKRGLIVLYTSSDAERLTTTVPDFSDYSVYDVRDVAESVGLNVTIAANSTLSNSELVCYSQSLPAGAEVEQGTTIVLNFKSNSGVTDVG